MNERHCRNLKADRKLGEYWERQFCTMMADAGKMFTPMQIGRTESASAWSRSNGKWNHFTLPDVTIWTAPGEHHELKHKTPTKGGRFGLERYRLDALIAFANETQDAVYYTIHDHHGNRESFDNRCEDWVTADVLWLAKATHTEYEGESYVNGTCKKVPIMYWNKQLFRPLFQDGVLATTCGT